MKLEFLPTEKQSFTTKQPLILAVDDHEDNLLLLTEVLSPINCSCITATHAQMALQLAQTHQPDLILLDVMLPDFNGIEVVHCLKQNPQTLTIPVIAVTALAGQEDRDRLLLAGCDDYISKPYMIDELEAIIHHHLSPVPALA